MTRIRVSREVEAPPPAVWATLADIAGHVRWMADAAAIEFEGEQRAGVGTRFECLTRVGPLRTRDRMEVTGWREGEEIAVRHAGLVRGEGRFTIRAAAPPGSTVVDWTERLHFPWYLGGPLTGAVAAPMLRRIWRGNLRRLAEAVGEAGGVDHRQPLGGPGEGHVERP